MAQEERGDELLLVFCCCLVVAHLVISVRKDLLPCLSWARSVFSAWHHSGEARFRGKAASARDDDMINKAVAREMASQREGKIKTVAKQLGYLVFCIIVASSYNMATATPRWMTAEQDAAVLLLMVGFLVTQISPEWLFSRHPWMWYCLSMLCTISFIAFADVSPVAITVTLSMTCIARTISALAYQRTALVFLMNVASSGAWLYFLSFTDELDEQGLAELKPMLLWFEMAFVLLIMVLAISASISTSAQARHMVLATTMSGEISAMTKMLNLVCDVIVELDADFQVVESAPRLAAMLTLSADGGARGMKLQHFMPLASDQERFEEQLKASRDDSDGCMPGALHVTLRDSLNNMLDVEIFYVHLQGHDGSRHYRVGMREFTDQPVAELKHFARNASRSKSEFRLRLVEDSRSSSHGSPSGSVRPDSASGPPQLADDPIPWPARSARPAADSRTFSRSPCGSVKLDAGIAPVQWPDSPRAWHMRETPLAASAGAAAQVVGKLQNREHQAAQAPQTSQLPISLSDERLAVPSGKSTAGSTIEVSLLCTVKHWNLVVGAGCSCCYYHDALSQLQAHLQKLRSKGCEQGFAPISEAQCQNCGMLDIQPGSDGKRLEPCTLCSCDAVCRLTSKATL